MYILEHQGDGFLNVSDIIFTVDMILNGEEYMTPRI